MSPTAPSPTEEVPFLFDELFFSRTDGRGIILSGNRVFQRISMYAWDELINKPHRIIRHPDMPKAVFWLLWETIRQGSPIGAYVKNRAKDGRFYWVFAIVTPIDDGYLSVRLKPSSPFLALIDQEYRGLVAKEKELGLKPSDSAKLLLARIGELGFPDYRAFMAKALSQEMAARNAQLGLADECGIESFGRLTASARQLMDRAARIFEAYREGQYTPLNLRVQSAQLAQEGTTMGVIADNYRVVSAEINDSMNTFMAAARHVTETIEHGVFLTGVAKIQREVHGTFRRESADGGDSFAPDMALLDRQQRLYQRKSADGLREIAAQAERFSEACTAMRRLAAGLEVTRIMGKVEAAHLSVASDGLTTLFDDLAAFQRVVADELKQMESANHAIRHDVQQLIDAHAA